MGVPRGRQRRTVAGIGRRATAHDLGFVAIVVGGALLTAAPLIFFRTYGFNDAIDWDDHRAFLTEVLAVATASVLVAAVLVRMSSRHSWRRALTGSALIGVAVHGVFGAIYAGLSMLPALDSAVGESASNWKCLGWVIALSGVSTVSWIAGQRLLRTS